MTLLCKSCGMDLGPLRSARRVPLGSRSAWRSHAIDSLMPEETPAGLGLRHRVFLAQAPAAEIRGPRRFCQPLFSAVICAKFWTRRKLPKALWEKEFNASTLKNHPHDFKKTPGGRDVKESIIFYAGCATPRVYWRTQYPFFAPCQRPTSRRSEPGCTPEYYE